MIVGGIILGTAAALYLRDVAWKRGWLHYGNGGWW